MRYDRAVCLFLPTSHWPLYSGPLWHGPALADESLSHLFSHECIYPVIASFFRFCYHYPSFFIQYSFVALQHAWLAVEW